MIQKRKTYAITASIAMLLAVYFIGKGAYEGYEVVEEQTEAQIQIEEQKAIEEEKVPYAAHFKEFAPIVGWEWEMLAAVGFAESRFKADAQSQFGASGIMQLMPSTAAKYGLNDSTVFEPRDNIEAGARSLATLKHRFRFVPDSVEQTKFVLAAYNAGIAHILDARALARKYEANPNRWEEVEPFLALLSDSVYYTDSVVRWGAFQGGETMRYVGRVHSVYHRIKLGKLKIN
ncbi:MAG: transglycosylase SLT domain-containing protein [Paludibacteraceae bacterium]|nr:transglycosylase SLT domain-containing protein [Paludibacteraceae bacterium]